MVEPKDIASPDELRARVAAERAFQSSMGSGALSPEERETREAYLARLEHAADLQSGDPDAKKAALYEDLQKLGDKSGCRASDTVESLEARRDALVASQKEKSDDADESRVYIGAHGEQGTLDAIALREQSERWNESLPELDAIQSGPLGAAGSLAGHALGLSDETRRSLAGLGAIGDGVALSLGADGRETDRLNAIKPELQVRRTEGLSHDQVNALAHEYARVVASNKDWHWDSHIPGGDELPESLRAEVREYARDAGLVPRVPMKPGTRTPDFEGAGLVLRGDYLPRELWSKKDGEQFAWLDARIPGGRPIGTIWHHSDEPGRMELVEFGVHNVVSHEGGRANGSWSKGPRK